MSAPRIFLLTDCAACAAPLAHDAPRCVRCKLRYCDQTCQHDHWRRGHKQMCKKIHRGGNAEQYHADKKYKEAVAVAVEACADDTKGQTCYICTEAVVRRTGEGLVSGFCACRGGSSYVHVSCLAEQAKIAVEEAVQNNYQNQRFQSKWDRWGGCALCGQDIDGDVRCALGWACWKTYVGLPDTDRVKSFALMMLGVGLLGVSKLEEALAVNKTNLDFLSRYRDAPRDTMLAIRSNMTNCLMGLHRHEEALELERECYADYVAMEGENSARAFSNAVNFSMMLKQCGHVAEATAFLRDRVPAARRILGADHRDTIKLMAYLGEVLVFTEDAAVEDMIVGQKYLEEASRKCQRIFGAGHYLTANYQQLAFVASRMIVYVQEGVPYTGAWTLREGTKSGDVPFEPKW